MGSSQSHRVYRVRNVSSLEITLVNSITTQSLGKVLFQLGVLDKSKNH